jgi:hypothetical protein
MATLSIQRNAPVYNSTLSSYTMTLSVVSNEDIIPYVFVKQRLSALDKNSFDDVFAAIATPAQLEELGKQAPNEFSSYFLDSSVTLIARTAEYMDWLYNEILAELNKLVLDYSLLATYANETVTNVVVTGSGVFSAPSNKPMTSIYLTPTGASPAISIDPTQTNLYVINLSQASGTPSFAFVNLTPDASGQIEVTQGTTNLNIDFPTGSKQGRGGGNVYLGAGTSTTDLINWVYDGTKILFSSEAGYS